MSKAGAVRCAPALDAPLPVRARSPARTRVSFEEGLRAGRSSEGDTRVSSNTSGTLTPPEDASVSPPRKSASRVSAGSATASEGDEEGGEDDGGEGAQGSEGAEGGQVLREAREVKKKSPAEISPDGIETSEERELLLSPLSC